MTNILFTLVLLAIIIPLITIPIVLCYKLISFVLDNENKFDNNAKNHTILN
ncbi:hypothetical protein [Elusimicrobium minutum]|uniref:hypothetical protein n=1 Tax=Elusimicrobium minutum TaxID=423605 RepID=UPI00164F2BA4|nr:hypothetical protein [Elusimicrobium minutum]